MKTSDKIKIYSVVFALLAFMCYRFGVSRTLEVRKAYFELEKEEQQIANLDSEIHSLSRREIQLDSILTTLNLGSASGENRLLGFLSQQEEKNQVVVTDFNPAHSVQLSNGDLITYDISLQGDFVEVLKTLYELETKFGLGRISHVHFRKIKERRTKKTKLESTIYLEEYR
nr:hypothetical protein [Allomuricauda sp.]